MKKEIPFEGFPFLFEKMRKRDNETMRGREFEILSLIFSFLKSLTPFRANARNLTAIADEKVMRKRDNASALYAKARKAFPLRGRGTA